MLTAPLHFFPPFAESLLEADKRGLLRSAFWLWVTLAVTCVVAVATLWVVLGWARSSRRVVRRRRIKDAWAEAGRRVEPLSHDDMQPSVDDAETDGPGGPT